MRLQVQTINDEPARASAYLAPLERLFNLVRDHKSVSLEPSF